MKIIYVLFLCFPFSCGAEIFKRTDPISGHVTFTNISPRDSVSDNKKMEDEKELSMLNISKVVDKKKIVAVSKRNDKFPVVDSKTQKERDIDRRNILLDELNSEKKLLAEKILKKSEPDVINRVKGNIASLERELLSVR